MSTNFPASLDDSTSLPNPTAVSKTNNPSHSDQHATANAAIKAIEAKVGTGATGPTANTLLRGTGAGTSAWGAITSAQLAAAISDETGTGAAVFAATPTLTTPKMDTINEETSANGVTVDGLSIKDGKLNTNNSVVATNITDSSVTSAKVAAGFPVQMVSTSSAAVATGTTLIPLDDTIPQNTEGIQFITQAITPKSLTNILVIEVVASLAHSGAAENIIGALFQDTTANALAANTAVQLTTDGSMIITVKHTMVANTVSSTTFKFHGGSNSAGTLTFNGRSAGRLFGAITKSSITITEYKA